ncbi:MAG: hypothetical protein LIO62_04645 [Clostridiales bacterium]|nr:hypothetical protein [Clostridiales bacterium]
MRFCLSRDDMVLAISVSPISDISLVAKPRALRVSCVLKFVTSLKSSSSKYNSVSIPSRDIIIYDTLLSTSFL